MVQPEANVSDASNEVPKPKVKSEAALYFEPRRAALEDRISRILGSEDQKLTQEQLDAASAEITAFNIHAYGYHLLRVREGAYRKSVSRAKTTYLSGYMQAFSAAIIRDLRLKVVPYDVLEVQSGIRLPVFEQLYDRNIIETATLDSESSEVIAQQNLSAYSFYIASQVARAAGIPYPDFAAFAERMFSPNVLDAFRFSPEGEYDDLAPDEFVRFFSAIRVTEPVLRAHSRGVVSDSDIADISLESTPDEQVFFRDVARTQIPTASEEILFFQDLDRLRLLRYSESEVIAIRNHLVHSNIRFVISIAKRYVSNPDDLSLFDLVQEGALGLQRAVDLFSWEHGTKLSTYASWWINQAVGRAQANSGLIRNPIHHQEEIGKLSRLMSEYLTARGHGFVSLTQGLREMREIIARAEGLGAQYDIDARICEILNTRRPYRELVRVIRTDFATTRLVRLDQKLKGGESEDLLLGDLIVDTKATEEAERFASQNEARRVLELALKDAELTPREQRVIRLRFGLEDGHSRTLEEIGIELGFTRERARQIESSALRKLRVSPGLRRWRTGLGDESF